MKLAFKKWFESIQIAAYNGVCTVVRIYNAKHKLKYINITHEQGWSNCEKRKQRTVKVQKSFAKI